MLHGLRRDAKDASDLGLDAAVQERAKLAVIVKITEYDGRVTQHLDLLVINDRGTVLIQPAVPVPESESPSWIFTTDLRPIVDITLGVPPSDQNEGAILGYLVLSRLMMPTGWLRLGGSCMAESHAGCERRRLTAALARIEQTEPER